MVEVGETCITLTVQRGEDKVREGKEQKGRGDELIDRGERK